MKITQELKSLLEEKDIEIAKLQAEKRQLVYDFAAGLEYSVGTKLKITTPKGEERFASVKHIKLDYWNDLELVLIKLKKDGTPSKVTDYISSSDKVEIVND